MPVWSIAKTCQEGLAPSPGFANALVRRSGTVLASGSPAGFTVVPMTVSTPSASKWAIAAAASGVPVMAAILQPCETAAPANSVLAADQLADESVDEAVDGRSPGRPDDELRQARVDVGVELPVQPIPARGDQFAGVEVRTTPADSRGELRGHLAVDDGQGNPEVIGFYLPPGPPLRRNAAGAEPPNQMSSGGTGLGATAAPATLKYRPL